MTALPGGYNVPGQLPGGYFPAGYWLEPPGALPSDRARTLIGAIERRIDVAADASAAALRDLIGTPPRRYALVAPRRNPPAAPFVIVNWFEAGGASDFEGPVSRTYQVTFTCYGDRAEDADRVAQAVLWCFSEVQAYDPAGVAVRRARLAWQAGVETQALRGPATAILLEPDPGPGMVRRYYEPVVFTFACSGGY